MPESFTNLWCVALEMFIYGSDQSQRKVFVAEIGGDAISLSWDDSEPGDFDEEALEKEPASQAGSADLAAAAGKPRTIRPGIGISPTSFICTAKMDVYRNREFKLTSNPGESEGDFRIRVSQLAREKRDREMETLREKYGSKVVRLEMRIRRAEQRLEKEKSDVKHVGMQTAISLGATLLGAFLGRKALSKGTIGRASTTMRSGMRTAKEKSDIATATENLEALLEKKADMESRFQNDLEELERSADPLQQKIETVELHPKKRDIDIRLMALIWLPQWVSGK